MKAHWMVDYKQGFDALPKTVLLQDFGLHQFHDGFL
jgi:hypothetical protein